MSPSTLLRGIAATALAVAVIVTGATTADAVGLAPASTASHLHRACATPARGHLACLAEVVVPSAAARKAAAAAPAASAAAIDGLRPADIASAYGLSGGTTGLVAIVDAYDNPNLESDLAVYRKQWGLPACTTANGCFSKVNQRGSKTGLPDQDADWGLEEALDVDAVSAACPSCKILLVEADDNSFSNLATAVNRAASLKVSAISNSYGSANDAGAGQLPGYDHPGIAVVASTGDNGYNVSAPASFRTVIAVGGTSLRRNGSARGWTESAWEGAGSGCSSLNPKPAWQTAVTKCNGKANADVSAVADPNTGVAVYDSYNESGWLVFGGTSASAPIIASLYTLSGRTAQYPAAYTWAHKSALYDVTSGSNGSCSPAVLCHAGPGWDGPTGLGTPKGIAAF